MPGALFAVLAFHRLCLDSSAPALPQSLRGTMPEAGMGAVGDTRPHWYSALMIAASLLFSTTYGTAKVIAERSANMAAKWFLAWMILVTLGAFFYAPASLGLGQISRIIFFHIPTAWVTVLGFLMCAIYSLASEEKATCDDMAASVSAELGFLSA